MSVAAASPDRQTPLASRAVGPSLSVGVRDGGEPDRRAAAVGNGDVHAVRVPV